jgi:hypothetical protein
MVCQLRPLVYSLGLNNPPRICLTPRKSRGKNLWCNKQGNCRCKMAGAGIRSFAKFHGQMPRIATTGITSWQTALKHTAECQLLVKIWPRNATDRTVPLINFPRNATNRATVLSPWHSAVWKLAFRGKIWAWNLAKDWIPVPAILHRQLPCLLRHNILTHDFPAVKPWRGKLFRPKLYTRGLSWHSISCWSWFAQRLQLRNIEKYLEKQKYETTFLHNTIVKIVKCIREQHVLFRTEFSRTYLKCQ